MANFEPKMNRFYCKCAGISETQFPPHSSLLSVNYSCNIVPEIISVISEINEVFVDACPDCFSVCAHDVGNSNTLCRSRIDYLGGGVSVPSIGLTNLD